MSLTSLVISGDAIFLAGPTSTVPRNVVFVEGAGYLMTPVLGGGFIERLLEFSPPKNLEKNLTTFCAKICFPKRAMMAFFATNWLNPPTTWYYTRNKPMV